MASVGNVMANKGLADLAAAVTPPGASKGNTGFGQCIQQTMDNRKPVEPVAVKPESSVKEQTGPFRQEGSPITESVSSKPDGLKDQTELTEEQLTLVNQKVRDTVKSALGIDEETMEAVLAEMGILPVELLQPENLQQFILLVDGGQGPMDFLMNEEMMADFNLVSDVLQALDVTEITQIPMAEILQQMTKLSEEIPVDLTVLPDAALADALSQESELPLSQEPEDFAGLQGEPEVIVSSQDSTKEAGNSTETEGIRIPANEQGAVTASVNVSDSASQNGSFQNMGNEDASNQQGAELPGQYTTVRPEAEPDFIAVGNQIQQQFAADSVSEIAAPQPTPQMVQIVEQIVEQIRIHAQADTTTMEMQLNPETLGKVLLTVSNRAGMMTAHFTVQTEEARMAVESQMYTLRENLEQKELKVDAVEVTVSNFEFTQSGSNGDDQKNMDQGDGRSRRFHMEEQEEDGEEISQEAEAERVRRNVMRDNGSSVDFIA